MYLLKPQIEQLKKFLCSVREEGYCVEACIPYFSVKAPHLQEANDLIIGDWKYRNIRHGHKTFSGEITVSYKDIPVWTMIYRGTFLLRGRSDICKIEVFRCLRQAFDALEKIDFDLPICGPKEYMCDYGFDEKACEYHNFYTGDITNFIGKEDVLLSLDGGEKQLAYRMRYSGGLIW